MCCPDRVSARKAQETGGLSDVPDPGKRAHGSITSLRPATERGLSLGWDIALGQAVSVG